MAEVQTLRRGNIFEEDSQLWRVLEYQHIKVARGGATIRVKLRNLRTGSTVEKTYNNGSRVNDVRLDKAEVQYLTRVSVDDLRIAVTRGFSVRGGLAWSG